MCFVVDNHGCKHLDMIVHETLLLLTWPNELVGFE
jgi:hypothetical protein